MRALEQLLTFRPANVVARLGPRSRVPLLGARELAQALEGRAPLLAVPVPRREVLPGLLRAARFQEAVLGLALPHPLAGRGAPERFVEAVRVAAEEAEHALPLFLQAGPLPVPAGDSEALAGAASGVYGCLEAGFTLVSLDASRLGEDAPARVAQLAAPVVERELALEVALPLTAPPPSPDALRAQLDALAQARVRPQFLRVDARQVRGAAFGGATSGEVEPSWVEPLREVAAGYGAQLTGVDPAGEGASAASPWRAVGVGKLELPAGVMRAALASLPPEARGAVEARASDLGLGAAEVLVLLGEQLPPLSAGEALRLEACAFAEVQELLQRLGLGGSARRVGAALAARGP